MKSFFCLFLFFLLYEEKMFTQHHEKLKWMMGAKRPKSLVFINSNMKLILFRYSSPSSIFFHQMALFLLGTGIKKLLKFCLLRLN